MCGTDRSESRLSPEMPEYECSRQDDILDLLLLVSEAAEVVAFPLAHLARCPAPRQAMRRAREAPLAKAEAGDMADGRAGSGMASFSQGLATESPTSRQNYELLTAALILSAGVLTFV